ncbi:MAG TPA: hypothetical protein ENG82_00970 [Bacteroidetes bacterium]|nr:hypothetical protein [Bacteroidota bacterium]
MEVIMPKLKLTVILLILFSGLFILSTAGHAGKDKTTENTCVNCHSKLSSSSFVGVKSHNWKGSIHQKNGVTCDKCHGGNPAAAKMNTAHVGVLSSSNPRSSVYFKNIPSTCGKCHGAEYYKFTQSKHFKKLETSGKGPDCVTCHGSMVTTVLNPEDMANVCDRCHNDRMGIFPYIPQKAKAVLLLIRESNALLIADQKLYHPETGSLNASYLQKAQSSLYSAKLEWHSFDLDVIINRLEKMDNSLKKLSRKNTRP